LASGRRPARPLRLHRQQFLERVRAEAGLASLRQAERVTDAVFAGLKEQRARPRHCAGPRPARPPGPGIGRISIPRSLARATILSCISRR
jgi:hypothetical protein